MNTGFLLKLNQLNRTVVINFMKPLIKIDFVSDVACPWCAVGLGNLGKAILELKNTADFEVHFRAFELNPNMPLGGQDTIEHLTQKYQMDERQIKVNQSRIRDKALEAGFQFHPEIRKKVSNTFNCHRLLYWAGQALGLDKQAALKKELLNTYFCLDQDLDNQSNLLDAAKRAGVDVEEAKKILDSNAYAQEVRHEETQFTAMGIHSVPSIIINDQFLLQGAQPPEQFVHAFEQLLITN